jgi:hypothetical protein
MTVNDLITALQRIVAQDAAAGTSEAYTCEYDADCGPAICYINSVTTIEHDVMRRVSRVMCKLHGLNCDETQMIALINIS